MYMFLDTPMLEDIIFVGIVCILLKAIFDEFCTWLCCYFVRQYNHEDNHPASHQRGFVVWSYLFSRRKIFWRVAICTLQPADWRTFQCRKNFLSRPRYYKLCGWLLWQLVWRIRGKIGRTKKRRANWNLTLDFGLNLVYNKTMKLKTTTWTCENLRNNRKCVYSSNTGKAVSEDHVRNSPSVKAWAGKDEFVVYPFKPWIRNHTTFSPHLIWGLERSSIKTCFSPPKQISRKSKKNGAKQRKLFCPTSTSWRVWRFLKLFNCYFFGWRANQFKLY